MAKVIESVTNISQGRDEAVLARLARSVSGIAGAKLVHTTADSDHNRSVFTILGEPEAVAEATFRLCHQTVTEVDMRRHAGVHPCIGAADVIPFVPLAGVEMSECVTLAEGFARQMWEVLGVPCFLYGEAARRENRRRLADIRRGGFGGLTEKLRLPDWMPDFGGTAPHASTGASSVGARWPLLAFNVNLLCKDVAIARDIARSIRTSSGGLPCLQAIGLMLHGADMAQVSMNLPDYRVTGLLDAYRAVQREAERRGVAIAGSELIGMLPRAALAGLGDASEAAALLGLSDFSEERILDNYYDR